MLCVIQNLQCIDDRLDVRLNGFVGKFRTGQSAHTLQSQVAQICFSVLQELTQLVTGSNQQIWLATEEKEKWTEFCANF